jgi:hypothetical protein
MMQAKFRHILSALMLFGMLGLVSCGGTKVYTIDKTLVYGNNMYNLSSVQKFSSRIEATLPDGEIRNLAAMDRSEFNAMLDEYSTLAVKTVIEMDQQELIYQAQRVKSYSEFNKMRKNLDTAVNNIRKFMANKKSTQLKLK